MRTGDTVRDGQGTTWVLGPLLGRGLWAKSWSVRRAGDDAVFVMKTALGPEDLRADTPRGDAVLLASREAVVELARMYGEQAAPWLPRLESRLQVEDQPALVLPRYPDTLERRLGEGQPLADLVEVLHAVARLLVPRGGGYHGGLHAGNVFFEEGGRILLADPLPPAAARALGALAAHAPGQAAHFPPEVVEGTVGPEVDGWALCMLLWRGCHFGGPTPPPPRGGLDKAAQVALRDRIQDRLKAEDSNPRFHVRLAERISVLLARGLSREVSPSPPFRFARLDELAQRLEEVGALIRPSVNQVGKVLLDRPATRPWFGTDEAVVFSCTVGTTAGVEGAEEIGVGIAVFDVDHDTRLKELDLGYSCERHPSGRHRFGFRIEGLGPGRYRARLAFAVRDSGHPPATAECEFAVVAAPGWAPRAATPTAAPLPFRPDESPTGVTEVGPAEPRRAVAAPPPVAGRAGLREGRSPPVEAAPEPRATSPDPPPAVRSAVPEVTAPAGLPRPIPAPAAAEPVPAPPPVASPPAERAPAIASPGAAPPAVRPVRRQPSVPTVPVLVDPRPRAAPIASPTVVVPAEDDAEPPVYRAPPGSWADEPLPEVPGRNLEPDEDVEPDAEDHEPSALSRLVHQLRTDPYLAVMAGLGLLTVLLLLLFLYLRR